MDILYYEQAVYERGTRTKMAQLMMNSKIVITMLALLFNDSAGDNISVVQGTETKESKNGFLELSFESQINGSFLHQINDGKSLTFFSS